MLDLNKVKNLENVKTVYGSVLNKTTSSSIELVVQQVNCLGVMGAGLAKCVRNDITDEKFENYKQLCIKTSAKDLLGKVLLIPSKSVKNRIYANIFAQENIGTNQIQTDYTALKTGLAKINKLAKDKGYIVKLPYKLGCGLAGGDWNIVYSIINEVCDVKFTTIYKLDSSESTKEPISTLHEPKIGSYKGDIKMKVKSLKGLENLEVEKDLHPVSELNRKDYLDNPRLLNKYFRCNNHDVEVVYIPDSVSIDTVRYDFQDFKLYKDKNYNPKDIENWTSDKLYLNLDASDDAFRDNDNDNRNKSGYEIYIQDEISDTALPQDIFEELYRVCIKAIKKRLVMLLDVEKIVDQLVNILKYTNGLSSNCTSFQASSLINVRKALIVKLQNKQVSKFIKENNDFSVFAKDELTRNDYIETYQRVLRKLTNITDSNLDFIRDIISNKEDSLENEIIANDLEKETISLNSNSDIEIKC